MRIEDSSLKEVFDKSYVQRLANGKTRPKAKNNYVGIVNLGKVEKSQEIYSDKKLFLEEDKKPLLFSLYDFASNDANEREEVLKAFKTETELEISLNAGVFDTLLPPIFLNELIKIINFGLYKEYVTKEENLIFARGKINIKSQIKNEIERKPRIACKFWEITTNNFLNQAILRAATILINKLNVGMVIKSKLALCASKIRQEFVDDIYVDANDFIKPRKIPRRYKAIINLAEAVIKRQHHSIKDKNVKCPSFMINIAIVWESFLRAAIRKEFQKRGWEVSKTGQKLKILDPPIKGIPDIILKKNRYYIILDAKYKPSKNNPDLYQLCAYLGSEYHNPKKKSEETLMGFLLYLGVLEGENESPDYKYLIGEEKIPINLLFLYKYLKNGDLNAFPERLYDEIYKKIID